MYRDTNCNDTCINALGAVLRYFLKIHVEQQQILFMLNLRINITFSLFTIKLYNTKNRTASGKPFKNQFVVTSRMQRDPGWYCPNPYPDNLYASLKCLFF